MRPGPLPSYEIIRSRLDYDPVTGIFTWKVDRGGGCRKGEVAGTLLPSGYVVIGLDRKQYAAARIAWMWMTGVEPDGLVDHRDLDRSNNRWWNLRLATYSQNKANGSLYSNNSSGVSGVQWYRPLRKWLARIGTTGNQIHLGYFNSKEEAIIARRAATLMHHGEFAGST